MNNSRMDSDRKLFDYALDLLYGALKYPCGWIKPRVYYGYFNNDKTGSIKKLFFDGLLGHGFKRTPWQLVYLGQTAGLI